MKIHAPGVLRRFTYANVMSTLAVFLVVSGGAAYAADTVFSADIVDGEVKSVDIGQNQVASGDVRNESLLAVDLAAGSVGSSEIADETVTGNDISNSTVTAFELATDSVGFSELAFGTLPSFTYQAQSSTGMDATTVKEVTQQCASRPDDEVTGGGFVIAGPGGVNVPNVVIQRSYAVSSDTWLTRAVVTSGAPTWQLTVIASCVG